MDINKLKIKINEWAEEGEKQKRDFRKRLNTEDGGSLNVTVEGFVNEIILPFITWIKARIKPG